MTNNTASAALYRAEPPCKPSGTRKCACGQIISANKTACKACNDKTEAS